VNDDGTAIASAVTITAAKVTKDRSVKISPNPASIILRVELSGYTGNVTMQLVNPQGIVLIQEKIETTDAKYIRQWNVGNLPGGIYFLAVVDEKRNRQTEKVIIER
jgi:hypothetical protein